MLTPTHRPTAVTDEQRPLLAVLLGLLRRRPIWVAAALVEALPPPYAKAQADELLPKLCYRFRNGGWTGGCWGPAPRTCVAPWRLCMLSTIIISRERLPSTLQHSR